MTTEAMRAAFEESLTNGRPEGTLLRDGDKYKLPFVEYAWTLWREAWQAATLDERDRCATLVLDSVKHTRLELLENIRKGEPS